MARASLALLTSAPGTPAGSAEAAAISASVRGVGRRRFRGLIHINLNK